MIDGISRRAGQLRDPRRASLVLFALLLVGFIGARLVLSRRVLAPQVLCDEFVYAGLARSFAEHGRLLLRGVPSHQSFSYPIALAPAWLLGSTSSAYAIAKAINVLLFAGAGAIVYAWARRLVSPLLALLPAALLFAMPAASYTALLMTDSAFLPAFLASAFVIALSLERPTARRQLGALALVGLACTVRVQGIVLGPILLAAIALMALSEAAGAPAGGRTDALLRRLRAHRLTGAIAAGALLAYALLHWTSPATLDRFGQVTSVTGADYSSAGVKHWTFLHLADLTLITGVVPLSALIIVLGLALGGRLQSPADRAFAAVAGAAVPLVLIEVGAFVSRYAGSISERYSFYLAPLLFLALTVWIGRGLPRPPVATALAMVIPLAALGNRSLKDFYAINLVPNDLGLYVFYRAGQKLAGGVERVEDLILLAGLAAVLAVALLSRRIARVVLPAAVLVFLAASSWPAFGILAGLSRNVRTAPGVSYSPQWVDRAIGRDANATYLYAVPPGGDPWNASTLALEIGFWNRAVDRVVNVGTPEICPLPEQSAAIDWRTGRVAGPTDARFVVANNSVTELAGKELAGDGPYRLYEVAPPLRLTGSWDGLYGDEWTGPSAAYTRYASPGIRRPRLRLRLWRPHWRGGPILKTRVHVAVGPAVADGTSLRLDHATATRVVEVQSGGQRIVTLPAPPAPFRVELSSDSPYMPTDYGSTDARLLGVQAHADVVEG